ncbi:Hypothetical predicted protein [Mytilus galloprovincialis]|uniref:CARD domain-containing protein n=1 Tax=Mytilus galloprovincialis TaxID=29158 RepID=A0A8B6CSN3_MYTGA|nr:Hypothetical predicted protein [Mytilus galloprovincialis]
MEITLHARMISPHLLCLGECDVLMLSNAEDEKFKEVMEKVGMAKKPLHIRQFKNSLLEWMKDPGGNEHLPSYIQKADDASQSPVEVSLKSNVVSEDYSEVPLLRKDKHLKQTGGTRALTVHKSEKKDVQPQQKDKLKPTQRLVKDQKQHGLVPYYEELINQTVLDKIVLDNLISRCILMIEDREEIIKPTTQRERNRLLLDILTDRPYDTFHVFKDVLKESEPHNSDVQELISRMQCTVNRDDNMSCHEININDNAIRIQKNYTLLVNNIVSTTDVTDYLIEEDIMQNEEREEVCASGHTTNESNRRLLDILLYKDRNGYHQLLKALRHAEYLQIANEVSNTAVTELDQKLYRIGITKFRERQDSKEEKFEGKNYSKFEKSIKFTRSTSPYSA